MPKLNCPKCGAFLQVDDDMIGTVVACGGCANEFVAAKPKPRYDYEQDDWSDEDDQPRPSSRRDKAIDDYDDNYDDSYDEEVDDFRRRRRYRRRQLPTDGKAIASLILGIVALICALGSFCTCGVASFISIPCGVIGIILGVMGMKPGSKGLAIGGIATAAVSIAITIAVIAAFGIMWFNRPAPPAGTRIVAPQPPQPQMNVPNQPNIPNQNKPGFPNQPGTQKKL